MSTYDRYSGFKVDGKIKIVPFVEIVKKDTDFYETYKKNQTRLDVLSYNYYGDAGYAWLIMQANPEYGSLEYAIPDGVSLRIPYPLEETLVRYGRAIEEYYILN